MTARQRHSHCSYCGSLFANEQPWPRACRPCGNISYLNPLPVAVTLLPVDGDENLEAFAAQTPREHVAVHFVVFDQQYSRHGLLPRADGVGRTGPPRTGQIELDLGLRLESL